MKRLTLLFSITMIMLLVSGLIASPASAMSITVRARGVAGSETINVTINGTIIGGPWTLTTSMANYVATTDLIGGICRVNYTNDASGRDVQVDYLVVNGPTPRAESQSTNKGVWQNSSCGGSYSEWMHCNGYIGF